MKSFRIFWLLVLFLSLITEISAQEVKIKGKYNGQKIEVTATRTPQGDFVTKLSYAPLSKLEGEVKDLKSQVKKLESEKKKLEEQKKKGQTDGGLADKLADCNRVLQSANQTLSEKEVEIKRLNESLSAVQSEVERTKSVNRDTIRTLMNRIDKLELAASGKGYNRNGIGLGACIGFDIMGNEQTRRDLWSRGIASAQQFELTYTHYFSKTKPVAIKVGAGFCMYRGSASFRGLMDTVVGLIDIDGDNYDGRYSYSDVSEKVNIKYLDIPLLLHIGNDYERMPVQGWFEAGLRMSFNVSTKVTGSGKYTLKGYYPAWNVEMENVAELGYVSNQNIYAEKPDYSINMFVLWGQVSAGIYVPIGKVLGLNFAARCGYSLTPVSKDMTADENHDYYLGQMSIINGGKTRILAAGLEIGLTYQF